MNSGMSMKLEGKQVVSWIKKNEKTDSVDLVLDSFGNESCLSFEPATFEAFVKAINDYQSSGNIMHSPAESCVGKTELVGFFLDISKDKRFTKYSIKLDPEDAMGNSIVLTIKSSFEELGFRFNHEQISKIISRFKTFLSAKHDLKMIGESA